MKHVRFGNTGLLVSPVWLGTATFGHQASEDEAVAVMNEAADLGVTVIDTAPTYPLGGGAALAGATEEIVGRWLKGRREQFLIASKFGGRMGPQPWQRGSSRGNLILGVENSLRRLQIDYLDVYQAHHYDPNTPIDETLQALQVLIQSGKVRYIGCSNFFAYQIARTLGRSALLDIPRLASVQQRYSLLSRQAEIETLPLCQEEGLAVVTFNVLAGGLLTGKYRREENPATSGRFGFSEGARLYRERYWGEREFLTISELGRIASEAGLSLPALAYAWTASKSAVTAPILGASRAGQIGECVAGATVHLDKDLVDLLDRVTNEFRYAELKP